jgi:hypothetical protein
MLCRGHRVVSWAFSGLRDVVAALFTGSGRLRGSAENKRRGLGVKARRARYAVVLVSGRGSSRRQSGLGQGAFRSREGVAWRWDGSSPLA